MSIFKVKFITEDKSLLDLKHNLRIYIRPGRNYKHLKEYSKNVGGNYVDKKENRLNAISKA